MSLVQWNPFHGMEDLFNRLERGNVVRAGRGAGDAWTPAVDITESPKEYTVKAELPGVKKDEVKVNVENGVLTVSGERKAEHEEKDARFHRVERSYGTYSRSFSLPDDVVQDKIAAEYKDGVLLVHLPKTDIKKTTPTQVAVQ
jgi:HSP20 family protein